MRHNNRLVRCTVAVLGAGVLLGVGVAPTMAATPTTGATPPPASAPASAAPAARPATPQPKPTKPKPTKPKPTKPTTRWKYTNGLPLRKWSKGKLVLKIQKRLNWVGYTDVPTGGKFDDRTRKAVLAFQEKFFLPQTGVVNAATNRKLIEIGYRTYKLPAACTTGTVLCADKTQKLLRFVVDGKVRKTFDARFGMAGFETGDGLFHVYRKSYDHYSSVYGSWMPFALFFNGGEAIHFSPGFQAYGYNGGSHGCINVRDFDGVKALYNKVPIGTSVYVYS